MWEGTRLILESIKARNSKPCSEESFVVSREYYTELCFSEMVQDLEGISYKSAAYNIVFTYKRIKSKPYSIPLGTPQILPNYEIDLNKNKLLAHFIDNSEVVSLFKNIPTNKLFYLSTRHKAIDYIRETVVKSDNDSFDFKTQVIFGNYYTVKNSLISTSRYLTITTLKEFNSKFNKNLRVK